MLGTTIAFTMAGGSQAANVIPQEAYVICNIRVAPGETVAGAVAALQAVADRHQVELEVLRSNEPSPVTDPRGEAFVRVERAIQAAWPGTEVLPFLREVTRGEAGPRTAASEGRKGLRLPLGFLKGLLKNNKTRHE